MAGNVEPCGEPVRAKVGGRDVNGLLLHQPGGGALQLLQSWGGGGRPSALRGPDPEIPAWSIRLAVSGPVCERAHCRHGRPTHAGSHNMGWPTCTCSAIANGRSIIWLCRRLSMRPTIGSVLGEVRARHAPPESADLGAGGHWWSLADLRLVSRDFRGRTGHQRRTSSKAGRVGATW